MYREFSLLLAALLGLHSAILAQAGPGFAAPEALGAEVLDRFEAGDTAGFRAIFPFEPGRMLLVGALADGIAPASDGAIVLRRERNAALLLLGGYLRYGNSGDETVAAARMAGLYRAARDDAGRWQLEAELPLSKQNRIVSHKLAVRLQPGVGLTVVDTIELRDIDSSGAAMRLNREAAIDRLTVNGSTPPWVFRSGVLWVDIPSSAAATLAISYAVDVARDSGTSVNSGRFAAEYGHVRNQYFWHPFTGFDDRADFTLAVDGPERWHVATDLPQQVFIAGGRRTVTARSEQPSPALSLFYDSGWEPASREIGNARMTVFATPDFRPSMDTLATAFADVVRILSARFGSPAGGYVGIVQQRARPAGSSGWPFMSNAVIAANWNGGALMELLPRPRAFFGHEISHGWTTARGPLRNMLMEGWATYAEAILLEERGGAEVVQAFWEQQRRAYMTAGYDGRIALTEDDGNGGVSYSKGAWVLRMLEEEIGRDAFDRGMRAFMAGGTGNGGSREVFISSMEGAAGRELHRFLDPWFEGRVVPRLAVRRSGDRWYLHQLQDGPLFTINVELAITGEHGTVRRTVRLEGPSVELEGIAPGTDGGAIVIDPDRRLLIRIDGPPDPR